MSLEHFSILLDNPSTRYTPGQIVSGRIVFKTPAFICVKDLHTRFEGQASVKLKGQPGNKRGKKGNPPPTPLPLTESVFYLPNKVEYHVLGEGGRPDIAIPPGEHGYQFQYQLPPKVPSSFVGMYGSVQYILKASITELLPSSSTTYSAERTVWVCPSLDLKTTAPSTLTPLKLEKSKQGGCFQCTGGNSSSMQVKLAKRGYFPGEILALEVQVKNNSKRTFEDVTADLVQKVVFSAKGRKVSTSKSICGVSRGQRVGPRESDTWAPQFEIPNDIPPTGLGGNCKLITVSYFLKVEALVDTKHSLKITSDVIIGYLPQTESLGVGGSRVPSATTHFVVPIPQLPYPAQSQLPYPTTTPLPASPFQSRRPSGNAAGTAANLTPPFNDSYNTIYNINLNPPNPIFVQP